jgi:hypothetical protein
LRSGLDVTPPEAEAVAEARGQARRGPSPEAEAWVRARQSSLLRPRLNLGGGSRPAVISFTLVVGTVAGAGRTVLFSCQNGQ